MNESAIRQLERKLESYREFLSRPGRTAPMNFAGADEIWSGVKRVVCDLWITRKAPITRKVPEVAQPKPKEKCSESAILDELGF